MTVEIIALFDMDDTLFDHNGQLISDLKKTQKTEDPPITASDVFSLPKYLIERSHQIRGTREWWANLPKFQLGWDIWQIAEELDFKREILTRANLKNPNMWSGKIDCIVKHFGYTIPPTITASLKSRHYGNLLVDDYPQYCLDWLSKRPRGLVIIPAHDYNKNFKHSQAIRYDGTNLGQVREAMEKLKLSRMPKH
jgi:hypothetical protein